MLRKQNLKNKQSGFTIVEVMIVLAIAGLIILIVLLAVPALQRNSRNNGVRNDAARIGGLIQELVNNSGNGQLPAANEVTGVGSGLTGNRVSLAPANANYARIGAIDYNIGTGFAALPQTLAQDTAYIRNSSICGTQGGGQGGVTGGTVRSVTITYLVESQGVVGATTGNGRNLNNFVSQCSSVN